MSSAKINSTRRTRRFGSEIRRHVSEERLRPRRRRVRMFAAIFGGICGLAIMGGFAWGSHQPRFQIGNIVVEGNSTVAAPALAAYADTVIHDGHFHLFSRSNILLFPRRAVEEGIEQAFPRVAHAKASIGSLGERTVMIRVNEREPYARWCSTSKCYLLDERGFLFAPEDGSSVLRDEVFEKGVVHEDGDVTGRYFLPSHFADVAETIRLIEREGMNVVRMSVESEHDFHLALQGGTVIYARFLDDPTVIAENLRIVLQSEALVGKMADLLYIDLRFKNRVYYKFK